jgi:hypothetical protein
MCEHLQETTSRYDTAKKVLTFVLVCRTCGTEQVVAQLDYEPRPIALSGEFRAVSTGPSDTNYVADVSLAGSGPSAP